MLKFWLPALAALILSALTNDVLKILCAVFLSPAFGFRCSDFTIFGKVFTEKDGKWKTSKGKFAPVSTCHVVIDMKKYNSGDMTGKSRALAICTFLIRAAIAAVACVLSAGSWVAIFGRGDSQPLDFFAFFYSGMLVYFAFWYLATTIYVHFFAQKKLIGYIDSKLNMLRGGSSFAELDMKPIDQLPYKYTEAEKNMYNSIYCMYLLSENRIDEMNEPIHTLTANYRYVSFSGNNSLTMMMLIFWYSRYELDPQTAKLFYDKTASSLANDTDPNTRRVLAYYAYGTERDPKKARYFLELARSGMDEWKIGSAAEKQLETRLLDELDEFLKNDGF